MSKNPSKNVTFEALQFQCSFHVFQLCRLTMYIENNYPHDREWSARSLMKKKYWAWKGKKKKIVLKIKFILLRAVVHWAQYTGRASTHTLNTLHTFPTLIRRKAVLQLMSSCKPNSSNISNALWIMSRTLHSMWCSTSLPASAHSHTQSVSQRSFYRHLYPVPKHSTPMYFRIISTDSYFFFFNL